MLLDLASAAKLSKQDFNWSAAPSLKENRGVHQVVSSLSSAVTFGPLVLGTLSARVPQTKRLTKHTLAKKNKKNTRIFVHKIDGKIHTAVKNVRPVSIR
jgi:hypothetical protein